MGDHGEEAELVTASSGDRYTMTEAARIKGVSYHTVSRAVRSGKLPAQRLGRMALIAARDLQAWRPMRERAPRKYRRAEPEARAQHERPVLTDVDPDMRYADRLLLAGEQLMEVASSQAMDQFGDWLARWFMSSLRMDTAVIWCAGEPNAPYTVYGAFGLDARPAPSSLSHEARSTLQHLAQSESITRLDGPELNRLDAGVGVDGEAALALPLHAGNRCVGVAIVARQAPDDAPSDDELAYAQRLASYAAFAIEHVDMRKASRQPQAPSLNFLDDLPLQVFAVDQNGMLIYVNNVVLQIFGQHVRSRYIGRHYSHFVRSFRRETLDGVEVQLEDHPITRALRGDTVHDHQYLAPDVAGDSRIFALSARPIHDEHGQQSGAVMIARDVTAEIEMDSDAPSPVAMLVDARRKVEMLARFLNDLAQRRKSEDDIFQFIATRACEVLDGDASTVLTPTVESQLVLRAAHNLPGSIGARVLKRMDFPSAILAMAHRDLFYINEEEAGTGGREMLKHSGARAALLVPMLDGDDVLGVLAVHYSNADRLRQVDPEFARAVGRHCGHAVKLRNVVTELEASRRRLLTTLDQLPQGVVIVDEVDGRIVAMNREAESLWGSASDRIGQHASTIEILDEFGQVVPGDRHPFLRPLHTQRTEFSVPLTTRDAAGNQVEILANVAPVLGRSGDLRGAVSVLQRREHVRPLDQAKDEFISVVAHELRNPLTSLRGNLQLLERRLHRMEGEAVEQEAERVAGVIEQVDRIGGLVSRMLDVSRADLGKLTIDPGEADAVQLAESAIADVSGELAERNVKLEAPESVAVEWDRVRVQQILVNLLTNAVRYAPEGDIHVSISTDESEQVAISVRDHGPGVPPRLRRRLFRLYYRFDSGEETSDGLAARQRGLGIGLYISARLAKAHGGDLRVGEAEGGGAVFTLSLPRVAQAN